METIIGIDLGTTFSAISSVDEYGKPYILENSEGKKLTPSVIYFDTNGNILIGEEAKEMQGLGEENVAAFFKRNMGENTFSLNFNGRSYTAKDLSALVLQKLKKDAEDALGTSVSKAVITVPAYFNNLQREDTIEAGKKAGLEVLRIINEPTAAAIAYGFSKSVNQRILVYDLGGGTFDVTIVDISDENISVIATGGDHMLGGKDWDDRIVNYITNLFDDEFGVNPMDDAVSFNDMLVKAEKAKRGLSVRDSVKIAVVHDSERGNYELTREKFEEITHDLLERTAMLTNKILEEADMTWNDLDGVLLVGGSTKMPMVTQWVEQMSGKPSIKGINVDEAVSLGAAMQASMEVQPKQDMLRLGGSSKKIDDVMSHSLGLIAENKDNTKYINTIIIPKNKQVPSVEERPYQLRTGRKIDNELEVYMTQGESDIPLQCKIIGKYVFSGIEHVGKGLTIIDVEYKYDDNGVINIAAKQRENSKRLDLRIDDVPHDLSWLDRPPEHKHVIPHVSVLLAVDLSGSMSGHPLMEAQKAANGFLKKLDLTNTSVGLICFADRVKINQPLTQNAKALSKGVKAWSSIMDRATVGYGNDTDPFREALEVLRNEDDPRFLIVLTDGVWSNQKLAIGRAAQCAEAGIEIVALGFGGADKKFLRAIATSDENALLTGLNGLAGSFSKIAQVLTETGGNLQVNTGSTAIGSKKGIFGFLSS